MIEISDVYFSTIYVRDVVWCDKILKWYSSNSTINLPIILGLGSEQALAPNREFEPDTFEGPWDKTRWGYHPFPAERLLTFRQRSLAQLPSQANDNTFKLYSRKMPSTESYIQENVKKEGTGTQDWPHLNWCDDWRSAGKPIWCVCGTQAEVVAATPVLLRTNHHSPTPGLETRHASVSPVPVFFFFILPTPGRKTRRRKCFETPEP